MKQKLDSDNREKILLAEDNEVNQDLAAEMLRLMGYDVDIAGDGEQALQALDRGNYRLVLMDYKMPVMNGCVATQAWRERERETQRQAIPIIALTAGEDALCLDVGMNDILHKPFDYENLSRIVHKWIDAKAGEVENYAENKEVALARPEVDSKSERYVLDQAQLDLLRNWRGKPNPELTERVMRLCLVQISQLCSEMFQAAEQGDATTVAGIAHILKSSSGTVGAMRLMNLCQKIETRCETTGTIEMELIERARQACADAELALKRELERLV
ncbi:MAG: response regulator [Gammaproteobacteria bacterium]|nr:response regulator [Gammaproteobacteria bacterium]